MLMTLTETWDIENELDIAVITKPKSHIYCCKGNALKNRENLEPENTLSLRGSKLQCCRTRKITTKNLLYLQILWGHESLSSYLK